MSDSEYDIDWTGCPDMERVPGRCGSTSTSPEEIDEMYPGIGIDRARRIIAYARQHARHPYPAG